MKRIAIAKIPTCWKRLVKMVFPTDLKGITSEKNCTGNFDPDPHYDDCRFIRGKFSNSKYSYCLHLLSGKNNYFGGITIYNSVGDAIVDEILESFNNRVLTDDDGNKYDIKIKLI